jgi:hypothetical protein
MHIDYFNLSNTWKEKLLKTNKKMNNERKFWKNFWCGKYVKLFEHNFSNVVTNEKVRF